MRNRVTVVALVTALLLGLALLSVPGAATSTSTCPASSAPG